MALLTGFVIFLVPLGDLTTVRRQIFERNIVSQGGRCCAELADATHCLVSERLPCAPFVTRYQLPDACCLVTENWLQSCLRSGRLEDEAGFAPVWSWRASPSRSRAALRRRSRSRSTEPRPLKRERTD